MNERYEFDEVSLLSSVAVGEPGKRTFFLAVGRESEWVRVWLEKEELQALALAVYQFLLTVSQDGPGASGEAETPGPSGQVVPGLPSAELEADEMSLQYEDGRGVVEVIAHALGPQREDRVMLRCRATLAQLRRFGSHALSVCAAGRPRCILCGLPIDPAGHVCPRSN